MIIENFQGKKKAPINTLSDYLKRYFGRKTVKLSIDGGFTCPNRDGTKGYGGCVFCSEFGSGDMASSALSAKDISKSIQEQISLLREKWPNSYYLAYFQSHTNTYAPISELREKFYAALSDPHIKGIVIGTRPDCIDDDVLDLLAELNRSTLLWVELGLQTIHEQTAKFINRCYDLSVYEDCVKRLQSRGIKVVTHLILGLPGESRENMAESVEYVCNLNIWGLKLHLLNIIEGSPLAKTHRNYTVFDSLEDYVNLVCDLLEIIPYNIVIHRMTGDAPRKTLISPQWSYKKRSILNGIYHELSKRGSVQGCKKAK
ncbi:MAG: TIGR01212 family radical SAM protein [Clostridiales bacterium]|nr:TIGR01212 family radical SAM protein [Clostridiales bacterium]